MAKVKQPTVALENRPGTLAHVAKVLADAKVNVLALLGSTAGAQGSVQVVVDAFVQHYNRSHRPFTWTATADSILQKIQRLCSRISGTPH
jgi:hypothetical protein